MPDFIWDTILLKEAYNGMRKVCNCTGLGQLQMPKHAQCAWSPQSDSAASNFLVQKLQTREGAENLSLPNATEWRDCWEVFCGLRDGKVFVGLMCAGECAAFPCLSTHLREEVTAPISNTAISQWQKVVEQEGSLNWALVRGKISQPWAGNEVFLQKSGVTRPGTASCRDVSEAEYDLVTSTH